MVALGVRKEIEIGNVFAIENKGACSVGGAA